MKHEDIDRITELLRYVELRGQTVLDEAHFEESLGNLLTELSALRERTRWRNFGDERPTHGQVCVVISHGHQLVAQFCEDGPDWDSLPWEHRRWSRSAQYENRWAPYPLPEDPQ